MQVVYYSLLYFKTMVLCNFDLLWKTMVLWKKLWYYIDNYGSSIYEGKKLVDYRRLRNFTKIIEVFEQIFSLRTLIYYEQNNGTMEKNYGTMEKSMVHVLWKKI